MGQDYGASTRVTLTPEPTIVPGPKDTPAVQAWWNRLAPDERSDWMDAAGSSQPADAFVAYQRFNAGANGDP